VRFKLRGSFQRQGRRNGTVDGVSRPAIDGDLLVQRLNGRELARLQSLECEGPGRSFVRANELARHPEMRSLWTLFYRLQCRPSETIRSECEVRPAR
jgi:hypothetical protein